MYTAQTDIISWLLASSSAIKLLWIVWFMGFPAQYMVSRRGIWCQGGQFLKKHLKNNSP